MMNDGDGLKDSEKLYLLKTCLEGHRKIIYENIVKKHRDKGFIGSDPSQLFEEVRRRLMKFQPSATVHNFRVQSEWDALVLKKNMSCVQFEAVWEMHLAELTKHGLRPSND